MKIRCLIVDDEPLALKLIKKHLDHFNQFEVVAECDNALKALNVLQTIHIDLIFMDIQMPEINGIELLKSLTFKPKVIITSAYKEFAIDGFDLDVVDFLLKPITIDRFLKAINKFLSYNRQFNIANENSEKTLKNLLIKDTKKTFKINPLDVLYIEGMREYVKINIGKEKVITKCSLIKFYEKLPKEFFIRVHKSYIINILKVKSFTPTTIEIGDIKIPIGRSYKISTIDVLKSV